MRRGGCVPAPPSHAGRSASPCRRGLAPLQLHGLGLEELLEAVPAVLTAVAGLLVAAERSVGVERAAVDLDLAGADLAGHRLRPLGIAAPHTTGQAVRRVVGDL